MTEEQNNDTQSLERLIGDKLQANEHLRTTGNLLNYEVEPGGVVKLDGPVSTRLIADEVIALVQNIPGVRKVDDAILPDPDLELNVAKAIAEDARTQSIKPGQVFLRSHNGALVLYGRLSEASVKDDLMMVAGSVKGVRTVIDKIVV